MGRAHKIIDTLVVILFLPFYVVMLPLVLVHDWLMQRRGVRLGQSVTHWPMCDVREDYLVADLSRMDEGLVGIRRRRWNLLGRRGGREAPPFPQEVEYIPRQRFWVPEPFLFRSRTSGSSQSVGQREEQSDSE